MKTIKYRGQEIDFEVIYWKIYTGLSHINTSYGGDRRIPCASGNV